MFFGLRRRNLERNQQLSSVFFPFLFSISVTREIQIGEIKSQPHANYAVSEVKPPTRSPYNAQKKMDNWQSPPADEAPDRKL